MRSVDNEVVKWALVAIACAAVGCRQSGVVVDVDTADDQKIPGVYKLTATVTAGGLTDTADIKDDKGLFMIPPPEQLFELSFEPKHRGEDATLLVQAQAADGHVIQEATVPFNTGQTERLVVRLGLPPNADLGLTCSGDAGQTDVNCGGGVCPPCAVDQRCARDRDCTTMTCVMGFCARAELSWVAVSPLPGPRSNLAAVQTSDGQLWAIGGYSKNATPAQLSDVDTYDPFSDTWTAQASLKKGRDSLSAAALANGAVAAGGGYVDVTGVADNTVEYYDPVAKTWTLGSHQLGQGRSAAAMTVQNGALLIIGGERNNSVPVTSIATVESEATPGVAGTWAFRTPMNRGLELFAAVTHANDVFVTGGTDTADSSQWEPLMSIQVGGQIGGGGWYDSSWMLHAGRHGHAAAVGSDGRIYVVGGNVSPGVVTGTAETLDVTVGRWIPMTATLRARDRLAAAVGPDGRIYAIGGSNNGVEVAFVDAYGPTIAFAPATPAANATVTVTGANFAPNAPVRLNMLDLGVAITTGVADGAGNLVPVTFTAPNSGSHVVQAVDDYSLYPVTRPLTVN